MWKGNLAECATKYERRPFCFALNKHSNLQFCGVYCTFYTPSLEDTFPMAQTKKCV